MAAQPATVAVCLPAHGHSSAPTLRAATQTLARPTRFRRPDPVRSPDHYETLLCQETAALQKKISPEPAPLLVIRVLSDEARQGPFPTARPLTAVSTSTTMSGRRYWVQSRTTTDRQTWIR
ncbi:hypothetical protein GWK47_054614 [Chionoecetes opilio]|uniref:Uncharacterized protein n=1 Tax=Chionoecetes opilio TaxID=41210 RepID=A0A8J4XZN6_CHIOP|nr:hypothetical protein GWK47_054614 [Chionoecetes opilio]